MRELYPAIKPYKTHELAVGDIHTLYLEECGNPAGKPILFLHGGPGGGCTRDSRRFFNPDRYRIILFDQRGAGRSKPHAELRENTTFDLVEDIEAIRSYFTIDRWLVFGGSWGSTLALIYAECHPERVAGLILRGIFLCRDEELHWFYQSGGASRLYPDHYEHFQQQIPVDERGDMIQAYNKRLTHESTAIRKQAAEAWSIWEGRCSTLRPNHQLEHYFADPAVAMAIARIECHYFFNHVFLEPNQILRNADRLRDIPGVIVQGRHDVVCPAGSAWALHKAWPDARLELIPDAGHASSEPGITHALIEATDVFSR